MAGRPKDSKITKTEKKIRTITWFKSVLIASNSENATQFARSKYADIDTERKLGNYAKGLNTPSETTLKLIEEQLPGTREIFDYGPRKSLLFHAMTEDIDHLIDYLETTTDHFFWLGTGCHEISFLKISEFELKKIVDLQEQIYFENKVYEIGPFLSDAPESFLTLLSGCIILLRFSIERDFHYAHSYVEDILNLIFHLLKKPDIENTLTFFSVRVLFLEWLFYLIEDWCEYSTAGQNFDMDCGLPTVKVFINNPHVFHTILLEAYVNNAKNYSGEKDYIDHTNNLVVSKKKKWFERYESL